MTLPFTQLILASTSPYRRELLSRLHLTFSVENPAVDETPLPNELPAAMASRLAIAKANAVASLYPQALVIGSDQVADLNGAALGKPGTHAKATAQLRAMQGQSVVFQTAVTIACPAQKIQLSALVPVTVRFRELSDAEIEHYLVTEKPYDCAGSAKSEGFGIALLSAIESNDPTALIGLPLIQTCTLLRQAGMEPLTP
jgi:septum formation protein